MGSILDLCMHSNENQNSHLGTQNKDERKLTIKEEDMGVKETVN
jgi:hypothetical protein